METFDGVYKTDEGTNIFVGNIVDYIRHFILKEFWNEVACNDKNFEGQNRGIDKVVLRTVLRIRTPTSKINKIEKCQSDNRTNKYKFYFI